MTLVLLGAFFSITFLFVGIFWVLYKKLFSTEKQISKRLEDFSKETPNDKKVDIPFIIRDEQLSDIPIFHHILEKMNVSRKLQRLLEQAGSSMKVGDLILRTVIFSAIGLVISFILSNMILKILCFLFLSSFSILNVYMQKTNRMKAFIREFPDALDMMTSAIRAGHALNQAMQLVGEEAPDPVGIEFKKTFEQYNLGLSLREALINLTNRIDSLDLKLFVTAILLQRETGGNLTEILEKISYTIRERFKLIGQLKTYTAQGRMSGFLVGGMPIAFLGIMSVLNKDYLQPLFNDKMGHFLIGLAACLQLVGFLIIRRIVRVKYQ